MVEVERKRAVKVPKTNEADEMPESTPKADALWPSATLSAFRNRKREGDLNKKVEFFYHVATR